MEFDYHILLPSTLYKCGRRFGKTEMFGYIFIYKKITSTKLGNYLYPNMKKKHQIWLNKSLENYINNRIVKDEEWTKRQK